MEPVGRCCVCGKSVCCDGGFLNGVLENGMLSCYECYREREARKEPGAGHRLLGEGTAWGEATDESALNAGEHRSDCGPLRRP